MNILHAYILLTNHTTEISLAFMTYICFEKELVNFELLTCNNYKFEVKDNYVYVLTKVFLDTGADIILASKSFSRCLNMTKQSNIQISGVLDETRAMQNIKMCKANIPY